jgi:UDP-4-amino-4,6-dideoxy-N-acetyl-beta-L-altrosamine N-acetyltransferase
MIDKIERYGIRFERLSEEKIDQVRQWRNSDDVRLFMQYQKIINPKQQLNWFRSIDNNNNYYFVAHKNKIPFGVYNLKDIDINQNKAEAGVFLISKDFWELDWSMRGSFLLIDFAFNTLGLETLTAHVLKSNHRAYRYNKQLGFFENKEISTTDAYFLELTKKHFLSKRNLSLIKYIEQYHG